MTLHTRYSASIGGTSIKATRSDGLRQNRKYVKTGPSGGLHALAQLPVQASPTATFDTHDLHTLMGILSNLDTPFASGALLLRYPRAAANDAPGNAGASTTVQLNAATARHYLDAFAWSSGQLATANVTSYLLSSNGSAAAFTESVVAEPTAETVCPGFVVSACTWATVEMSPQSVNIRCLHRASNSVPGAFAGGLPLPVRCVSAGVLGSLGFEAEIQTPHLDFAIADTGTLSVVFSALAADAPGLASPAVTVTVALTGVVEADINSTDGSPSMRRLKILGRGTRSLVVTRSA